MSIDTFWMAEREYNPEEAYYNEADGLYYCVDCKRKMAHKRKSIAYINGVKRDEEFKEIRLMN